MGKGTQGIHRLTVEQNVELHQVGRTEAVYVIIEGSISLGDALQLIIEVDNDFAKRQHEVQLHTVATHILLLNELASLVETKFHDRTNIVARCDDGGADIGFLDMVDHRWVRQSRRIVHLFLAALLVVYHIGYVGHGGDDVHVELAVESFLYDLHVEQTQEATTETEA